MRKGEQWGMTFEEFVLQEQRTRPIGGQIYSFDAVFSPRGEDGQPRFLFDRKTGVIDREVAQEWKKYDISWILRTQWTRLGPLLPGKIHVIVGTRDTFRLDGAVELLDAELKRLGSDAEILFVPGRDHGDLYAPHQDLYPHGLHVRCARQMWDSYEAALGRGSLARAATKTRATRSGRDSARANVDPSTLAHVQDQGVTAAQ